MQDLTPIIGRLAMTESSMNWLHQSLTRRETPESVAACVQMALGGDIPPRTRAALQTVLLGSLKTRFGWSSMSTAFRAADPMDRQIAKARELARAFLAAELPEAEDPHELEAFIAQFSSLLRRPLGAGNFAADRLNRTARAKAGLLLSRRRYDKLFRMASRLEDRLARLRRETDKHALLLIGKSALAPDIKVDDLAGRRWTASFIAYFAARMKLRSEFTILGQQKPFDELSAELLAGCAQHEEANWFAIAHVFPREDILARLSDTQKGSLLGRWYRILVQTAEMLAQAHARSSINLDTMIVKRGDDSSTWNTFAGAWNRGRDHWIAFVAALGMERIFDALLPGKVMRLMAGDVAAWHRTTGGALHPDTMVWRELPKPWLVLSGTAVCTRDMITQACARHGVDPEKSGWSAARPRTAIAEFKPTPELVHGVSVENPYFAHFLRRLGAFSGKQLKPEILAEIVGQP